jgi:hypothetical protein
MNLKISQVVAGAAVVGALAFGGVSLAAAQTAGSSPTTTPGTPAAPHGGHDCPNMGGHPSGPASPGPGAAPQM